MAGAVVFTRSVKKSKTYDPTGVVTVERMGNVKREECIYCGVQLVGKRRAYCSTWCRKETGKERARLSRLIERIESTTALGGRSWRTEERLELSRLRLEDIENA